MQKNTLNFFMTVLLGMLICVMFARCDSNSSSGDPADCVGDECEEECVGAECDVNPIEDADGDTIADGEDNCPDVFNTQQTNSDTDALGDSCDLCPTDVDETNADTDADGTGDACDTDATGGEGEGEGEGDADADADAEGDADADADGDAAAAAAADGDGDGIADTTDNCTSVSNVDQKDTDADRMGDACDPDDDNDGILDDGNYTVIIGDSYCEPDDTGNCDDNCITVSNVDQADFDEDHIGDACDLDSDNDGLCDHDTLCTDIDNSERLVDLWYFVSQDATKSPPSVEGGYSYRFIEGKGAGAIIVVQGLTDRTLAEGTVGRCPGSGTTAKVGICILDFSIK